MFQFTGFPTHGYVFTIRRLRFAQPGFPIQISMDQGSFAPPHGFSQLITSFIGSQCQGIRPVPLLLDLSLHHPSVGDAVVWFSLFLITLLSMSSYLAFYEILSYLLTFCIKDIWLTFNQISCMQFSRYISDWSFISHQKSQMLFQLHLKSLITGKFSFFFFDLAPTCSPTPSPVQYHRPIGS